MTMQDVALKQPLQETLDTQHWILLCPVLSAVSTSKFV